MPIKQLGIIILVVLLIVLTTHFLTVKSNELPLIAIASFGPHSSLAASIQGIKDELARQGYGEQQVRYEIADVGFDASLIPQMIASLKNHHPHALVVMTTPVAQYAKGVINDIPLIYSVITDPIASGLIKQANQADANMTGSSDKQDLDLLLDFARQALKNPTRVGVLYATTEANDLALVRMMKQAAARHAMQVLAIPIDEARTIPLVMQQFKHRVDFIYVGASGIIQPALPIISAESRKMGIPVFNVNEAAVKEHSVLASFGVNYHQVGVNTGRLVVALLQGKPIASLAPVYPSGTDYQGFLSAANAQELGLPLPITLHHAKIVR